jgi:hypothetical protein
MSRFVLGWSIESGSPENAQGSVKKTKVNDPRKENSKAHMRSGIVHVARKRIYDQTGHEQGKAKSIHMTHRRSNIGVAKYWEKFKC